MEKVSIGCLRAWPGLVIVPRTYDFIESHQVDWTNGEWHDTITPEGKAQGDKAQIWKAGYHNGRAMIECLEMFKQKN